MVRARDAGSLRRRGPQREPYDYVLIVCEGGKTEPNYLNEMIRHLQLSSANVKVTGDCGSNPRSIVDDAIRRFDDDPRFDRVFCVFDRDTHDYYDESLQRVREHSLVRRDGRRRLGRAKFEAITSVPCFEYWVLLHFEYTTAELLRFADVQTRMRAHNDLRGYSKGGRGLFDLLQPRLSTALQHADRANAAALASDTDNPSTRMPDLMRYLMELGKAGRR
jgi:hypothetical protein